MKSLLSIVTFFAAATCMQAGPPLPPHERILIPIRAQSVPGAAGSVWTSTLAITNHSDHAIRITGYGRCDLGVCPPPAPLRAKETVFVSTYSPFLSLYAPDSNDVAVQLRIQDVSRQSQTFGTTIPVVRERNAYQARTISLTDIPRSAEFRATLRVYDFDPPEEFDSPARNVKIRFYAVSSSHTEPGTGSDVLISETTQAFRIDSGDPFNPPPLIEMPLGGVEAVPGYDRMRIEIEPVQADLRYWAFVSITSNATQHVTVVTPQ